MQSVVCKRFLYDIGHSLRKIMQEKAPTEALVGRGDARFSDGLGKRTSKDGALRRRKPPLFISKISALKWQGTWREAKFRNARADHLIQTGRSITSQLFQPHSWKNSAIVRKVARKGDATALDDARQR
jgi:hypothetical protein